MLVFRSKLAILFAFASSLVGCADAPSTPSPNTDGVVFYTSGPDAMRYGGMAGGFAQAGRSNWAQPGYSVDGFSRLDEIWPAATVRRGPAITAWRRAASASSLTYEAPQQSGGGRFTIAQYLQRNPTTGLLIARGDTILAEHYQYGRNDRHRLTSFSMAKTITAMLIGLAVADGAIASIDDPAQRYVPELAGSEYGRTPLRHLLTMSSGVAFREDYDGTDDSARLSRATLGQQGAGGASAVLAFNQRNAAPGAHWYYASAETQVLGLVLRAAIQRPIVDYLAERIWHPMGAESEASWLIDRSGQEITYGFFNAVMRDYGRFGLLLANDGRVGERQLIPVTWLKEATRAHFTGSQTGRWYGYGFQTWVFPENDGSFALLGVRGQAIFVDPARKLVMVHMAVRPNARDAGGAETIALWRAVKRELGR